MSCKALGMSISTYYYEPKPDSFRKDDQMIINKIIKIIEDLPESGYRPVNELLNDDDLIINHKKTNRIMRENNLLCRKKKRFSKGSTDSRHNFLKYPNITKELIPDDVSQLIVGDVTAYDIKGKDHYLASLMDVYNREIIGRAVSDKNDTELVLAALNDAHQNRGNDLTGAIHHTDADVRYCSKEYISKLEEFGMKISMCVGNAYENAYAESFNKTIKRQEINISDYESKEESAKSIFRFIELYNTYRPHSSLNNMTPEAFKNSRNNREKLESALQF
jgi:putative transposase